MADHREHAGQVAAAIRSGGLSPEAFRRTLEALPSRERDLWLDAVLCLDPLMADGPDLPAGCVPFMPCPVSTVLRLVTLADIGPGDVFVDIGSGTGRVLALVHLLTGAAAIGVEAQAALVDAARGMAADLGLERVRTIHADVADLPDLVPTGTVFLLYCPFSGPRLERLLDTLEPIARARPVRVCAIQLPPLERAWLTPGVVEGGVAMYRSG